MPSTPESRAESVNNALEIGMFLAKHNENLKKRYVRNPNQATGYQVYDLDEDLPNIDTPGYRYFDTDFARSLLEFKETNNFDKLLSRTSAYIQKSFEYQQSTEKKVKSSSGQGKLRRTAFLIFKNLIIPNQTLFKGGFKYVTGPIGVDPGLKKDFAYNIITSQKPTWCWNGNFDVPVEGDKKVVEASTLVVKAETKKDGDPEQLNDEFKIVKHISDINECKDIVPEIKTNSAKSVYVEYLPTPYGHQTSTESLIASIALSEGIERVWKNAGVLNFDIKPTNLKLRKNGHPVIIDWGAYSKVDTLKETFDPLIITSCTGPFMPPEAVDAFCRRGFSDELGVEKFMVYQVATVMFVDIFGPKLVKSALMGGSGFYWNEPYFKTKDFDDAISIDEDTVRSVIDKIPNFSENYPQLSQLLLASTNKDPSVRPDIHTYRSLIAEILRTEKQFITIKEKDEDVQTINDLVYSNSYKK